MSNDFYYNDLGFSNIFFSKISSEHVNDTGYFINNVDICNNFHPFNTNMSGNKAQANINDYFSNDVNLNTIFCGINSTFNPVIKSSSNVAQYTNTFVTPNYLMNNVYWCSNTSGGRITIQVFSQTTLNYLICSGGGGGSIAQAHTGVTGQKYWGSAGSGGNVSNSFIVLNPGIYDISMNVGSGGSGATRGGSFNRYVGTESTNGISSSMYINNSLQQNVSGGLSSANNGRIYQGNNNSGIKQYSINSINIGNFGVSGGGGGQLNSNGLGGTGGSNSGPGVYSNYTGGIAGQGGPGQNGFGGGGGGGGAVITGSTAGVPTGNGGGGGSGCVIIWW